MSLIRSHILVCTGTGCTSSESPKIIAEFEKQLAAQGMDKEAQVVRTGCFGLCALGPIVTIYPEGACYTHVTVDDVEEIVSEHIVKGRIVKRLLNKNEGGDGPATSLAETRFYKHQHRIALRNCGVINPESIDEYIGVDGYAALGKILTEHIPPQQVIDTVLASGLRGRGGAGFPTGKKWQFTADAVSPDGVKYVCCNADEGDPGAFMDRSMMEGDPHRVLEGMIIAGIATQAHQGYIYVRAEYPLAVERLSMAIDQARQRGLLGTNILDSGFDFDIHISQGAGAFVCGEGSALTASIEGNRGMPRVKPPRTVEHGLFDSPTVLNNVETYCNVAPIIQKGAAWYKTIGPENNHGTKAFALTGNVNNTGLIEVPMGTTLREIIFDIGGGIKDGKKFKAHVPAGVKDGQKIKLAGKGKPGINGGKAGDLYLHVTVKPDATFSMRGHDIVMDLPVTVGQAVAGGKVEAKDIDGNPVTFKVPAGSSSGAEVKLAGLGVQRSNQPGDLIGRVQIMVPAKPGLAVKHAAKEFDEKAGDYLSL